MASPRASRRHALLLKLIAAFAIPTAILFSVFAFFAYQVQRRDLEAELGRRLEAVASSAATRLRGKYLKDLRGGDEAENLYYAGGMKRLEEVRAATGVERLYVFDRNFETRLDTAGGLIGEKQFQAEIDRREVTRVFETKATASSLLFDGVDGRPYKAGYAPVFASEDDASVVLAIGVDAPADFFERLADLRGSLFAYGVFLVLAIAAVAVLIGLRITRPVRALAEAAEKIGAGDLTETIAVTTKDEIGLLAATMEQMRSDLRARDERMQLMLAGIAHEVRNPLAGIELFSGILREDLEGDEEKSAHVARIDKEIGYLKSVVDSFLDYARRPALERSEVRLDELAREVASLEEARASAAEIAIDLELAELRASVDPAQLRRALLNLVRNAVQAADGHRRPVRIVLSQTDAAIELSVENWGEEISPETRAHLFEPFVTTKEKGTGLGLAFVKEIVEEHGGSIAFCSQLADDEESQGSGLAQTRFTISLPRSPG